MSMPSAEARARELDELYSISTPCRLAIVVQLRAAESAARAEQLEADCRAVCRECNAGTKLIRVGEAWFHDTEAVRGEWCKAAPIRAGGETEST